MNLPGMDQQLAQVLYNDRLQQAAANRTQRRQPLGAVKPAARRLPLLFAAAAPLTLWLLWVLAGH